MANGWHRRNPNSAAAQARAKEYDSAHFRAARLQAKTQVDAGGARCWRCHLPIPPGSNWHLGHHDADRSVLMGPEHARCNLKAAASKGARMANAKRKAQRQGVTALRM